MNGLDLLDALLAFRESKVDLAEVEIRVMALQGDFLSQATTRACQAQRFIDNEKMINCLVVCARKP